MLAAARERGMKKTGVTVSVRDNDFCHLSYYLCCATKSVGIDIVQDDLIDYKNAHRLSRGRKDGLLKLAYELFDPDTTVGKVFYPDQNGLCGNSQNEFYEVTQVDTILAVDSSILIGGQEKTVAKIMVFKDSWLKDHYHTPIRNQMSRIRQICDVKEDSDDELATALAKLFLVGLAAAITDDDEDDKNEVSTSDHCQHCRGCDGTCACDSGCPIKPTTKCSKVHHCDHCKGFDAVCVCTHGCPEGIYSKCRVEHTGVLCDGCMQQDIKGPRFKCANCANFDLCEKCYNQGARTHDTTHAFNRMDRVGSELVHLEARQQAKPKYVSPVSPRITATTPSYEAAKFVSPEPDVFVMPETTVPSDAPFAKATPVYDGAPSSGTSSSGFAVGDAVKLVGLKAETMNGVSAVVERDTPMAGGRIQIRLSEQEPGKLLCVKPENLQKMQTFQVGQMVVLTGLNNKEMNGSTGLVADCSVPGERIMIRLYEGKTVSIKPENLEVIANIID